MAQLARAPPWHGGDRGFESLRVHRSFLFLKVRSEMAITSVSKTDIPGSNPGGPALNEESRNPNGPARDNTPLYTPKFFKEILGFPGGS